MKNDKKDQAYLALNLLSEIENDTKMQLDKSKFIGLFEAKYSS